MSADKLNGFVKKEALSNQAKRDEAIRKADSYSFAVSHPEFLQTKENVRLLDYQLRTMGIDNPTYPDFDAAYNSLKAEGLLELDAAELAREGNRTYVGTLTKQEFYSLDDMLVAERQAALTVAPPSEEELEFQHLPNEQVLPMLKQLEHAEQHKGDGPQTASNADAWLTTPSGLTFVDNDRNGHLMSLQLKTNGVIEGVATIAEFEQAYQDLRPSGLLSLNQKQLAKQQGKELQQRAADALAEVRGNTFSEDEAYTMDLEELKKRANATMGR
jgi:hypothetical protein